MFECRNKKQPLCYSRFSAIYVPSVFKIGQVILLITFDILKQRYKNFTIHLIVYQYILRYLTQDQNKVATVANNFPLLTYSAILVSTARRKHQFNTDT